MISDTYRNCKGDIIRDDNSNVREITWKRILEKCKLVNGEKSSDVMPKINPKELKSLDLMFLKQAEEINFKRAIKYQKTRRSNTMYGLSLGAAVLGIYFYSMYAVKQETFLDDFNEPETIIVEPNTKAKAI